MTAGGTFSFVSIPTMGGFDWPVRRFPRPSISALERPTGFIDNTL